MHYMEAIVALTTHPKMIIWEILGL